MRIILFNLYPYRALRETRRKRRVVAELAMGAVLGLGVCYAIGGEFQERVARQEAFLGNLSAMESELAAQVAQVQAMKNRVAVLSRQVNALEAVEKESILPSRWISYLDATVPSSVSMTSLLVSQDVLTINGFTDAVSSLAQWVDQMETGNSLFVSVDLVSVTEPSGTDKKVQGNRHLFEIKAVLRGVENAPR
ncbi:MAG: PilN domain-containing protein [Burkholderiales bacterium]|jgi:Tfp pilus assembly protein PilN|uniref:PilN domain-containing protein n=1 Tax=Limnobacter sp. TaxID=2003368 RepID=UPI00395F7B8F|nr:PilN domain-containing protein [Burkholderiales bacterium]